MLKKSVWALAVIVFLLASLPAQAQVSDVNWAVKLYEPSSGRLDTISGSGQITDSFTLPLAVGFDHHPAQVAVGHGGSLFAYVPYNSSTYQGILIVSQRERLIASYNLPLTIATSLEFIADESVFSDDNSRVALGYSLDGGGWGIIVLNILNGAVDYSIRSDMPSVALLGLPNTPGLTPVIRQFNLQTVTFNLVLSGSESGSALKAYDWKLDSNELQLNPVYTSLDSDRFNDTNEVIMVAADDRLENQKTAFPVFQANSIQVYQAVTGARFPFFNLPDATLQTPRFIQNGERIMVDTATADGRYAWTVVDRSGAVVGTLPTAITLNEAKGTADGFVYTTDTFAPGARTLVYVNTRNGLNAGVPIWTSGANEQPVIVWAGSTLVSAQSVGGRIYTQWQQLAEPVYAPGSIPIIAPAPNQPLLVSPQDIVTPQATRNYNAVLTAGGLAVVHTTNGDQLNVRAGAGTSYLIVAKLGDGARVTLIEGPTRADGFQWWHIRTDSGIAGWVVDSVNGDDGKRLETLLPA
ncbi:MAG: SH3 domain-containing protein [Anaerolineaceae bacterium]|nr:SH3 domain-containing protein [Anaerolineaceae bacterium]